VRTASRLATLAWKRIELGIVDFNGVDAMVLKLGPSGGISGANFYDTVAKPPQNLIGIYLANGDAIVEIDFHWSDGSITGIKGTDDAPYNGYCNLTPGRPPPLDMGPLTQISGQIGSWNGYTVVTSILFTFSREDNPTWGMNPHLVGVPFVYDVPPGQGLVGVFGYTGAVIDQIGFKFDKLPG
jgi:hypothetical protein